MTQHEQLCQALAAFFRESGRLLWTGGYIVGPDRVSGESPFDFGSDATVGLATVAQTAGELTSGAVDLLGAGNLYGAAALCRQLVEVEYLAWAFAEDEEQASHWLRANREERFELWRPGQLRKRSAGRFRDSDYWMHCEHGGHPTPEGRRLLGSVDQEGFDAWWADLATHASRIFRSLEIATEHAGYTQAVDSLDSTPAARRMLNAWDAERAQPES